MNNSFRLICILILGSLFLSSCSIIEGDAMDSYPLGAGFRYSAYGPPYNPGPEYWANVGIQMAEKFEGAVPQGIWIIGQISGKGTFINFPTGVDDPNVYDMAVDGNQATFDLFDELGV